MRWLDRKAENQLSQNELAALTAHLSTCPACTGQASELEWVSQVLEKGRRPLPSGFAARVLEALPRAKAVKRERGLSSWVWMPAAAAMFAALGALGLGLGVGLGRWFDGPLERRAAMPHTQIELELSDARARTVA